MTVIKAKKCPKCLGTGRSKSGSRCSRCKGSGEIVISKTKSKQMAAY